jgi:hypothetical protein
MDMQTALKAGGVGAAALFVLTILGAIPIVGEFIKILSFVAYIGVGYLASYWMEPPRRMGMSAGTGAVAALIAGLAAGITDMIVSAIVTGFHIAIGGGPVLSDPELMAGLPEIATDPEMVGALVLGIIGFLLGNAICCVAGMAIAAVLGAVGGAIHAAIKPTD